MGEIEISSSAISDRQDYDQKLDSDSLCTVSMTTCDRRIADSHSAFPDRSRSDYLCDVSSLAGRLITILKK
jgi:hypothetical protein